MNKLSIALCLISLVLLADVGFAMPGIPNQFWGTVTINGNPASDGTSVTATINGVSAGSATVSGGSYSLIAEDPNSQNTGKTVLLFVNGVQAASDIFLNGKVTQLNLAVTIALPPTPPSNPGGGGGSGSTITSTQTNTSKKDNTTNQPTGSQQTTLNTESECREKWLCSDWSDCSGGIQTRTCADANNCGTQNNQPFESQPCTSAETKASETFSLGGLSPTGFAVSGALENPLGVGIILVIIAAIIYLAMRSRKKKR